MLVRVSCYIVWQQQQKSTKNQEYSITKTVDQGENLLDIHVPIAD